MASNTSSSGSKNAKTAKKVGRFQSLPFHAYLSQIAQRLFEINESDQSFGIPWCSFARHQLSVPTIKIDGIELSTILSSQSISKQHISSFQNQNSHLFDIPASKLFLSNPTWRIDPENLIPEVVSRLRLGSNTSINLEKLLILEKGSVFNSNQMLIQDPLSVCAHMIVLLPSIHNGGDFKVSYKDQSEIISLKRNARGSPMIFGFYRQTSVVSNTPISDGRIVALVYSFRSIHCPSIFPPLNTIANEFLSLCKNWIDICDEKQIYSNLMFGRRTFSEFDTLDVKCTYMPLQLLKQARKLFGCDIFLLDKRKMIVDSIPKLKILDFTEDPICYSPDDADGFIALVHPKARSALRVTSFEIDEFNSKTNTNKTQTNINKQKQTEIFETLIVTRPTYDPDDEEWANLVETIPYLNVPPKPNWENRFPPVWYCLDRVFVVEKDTALKYAKGLMFVDHSNSPREMFSVFDKWKISYDDFFGLFVERIQNLALSSRLKCLTMFWMLRHCIYFNDGLFSHFIKNELQFKSVLAFVSMHVGMQMSPDLEGFSKLMDLVFLQTVMADENLLVSSDEIGRMLQYFNYPKILMNSYENLIDQHMMSQVNTKLLHHVWCLAFDQRWIRHYRLQTAKNVLRLGRILASSVSKPTSRHRALTQCVLSVVAGNCFTQVEKQKILSLSCDRSNLIQNQFQNVAPISPSSELNSISPRISNQTEIFETRLPRFEEIIPLSWNPVFDILPPKIIKDFFSRCYFELWFNEDLSSDGAFNIQPNTEKHQFFSSLLKHFPVIRGSFDTDARPWAEDVERECWCLLLSLAATIGDFEVIKQLFEQVPGEGLEQVSAVRTFAYSVKVALKNLKLVEQRNKFRELVFSFLRKHIQNKMWNVFIYVFTECAVDLDLGEFVLSKEKFLDCAITHESGRRSTTNGWQLLLPRYVRFNLPDPTLGLELMSTEYFEWILNNNEGGFSNIAVLSHFFHLFSSLRGYGHDSRLEQAHFLASKVIILTSLICGSKNKENLSLDRHPWKVDELTEVSGFSRDGARFCEALTKLLLNMDMPSFDGFQLAHCFRLNLTLTHSSIRDHSFDNIELIQKVVNWLGFKNATKQNRNLMKLISFAIPGNYHSSTRSADLEIFEVYSPPNPGAVFESVYFEWVETSEKKLRVRKLYYPIQQFQKSINEGRGLENTPLMKWNRSDQKNVSKSFLYKEESNHESLEIHDYHSEMSENDQNENEEEGEEEEGKEEEEEEEGEEEEEEEGEEEEEEEEGNNEGKEEVSDEDN